MTSRDLDDKAIVRRKPEAPQIRLIRQAKQRVKLGLDFEGVTLESLAKDMPELKAGRIEEAVIVQLNQYFQQLGGFDQIFNLYNPLVMETAERPLLIYVMKLCRNNQIEAAKILGINRNTLRSKLRSHKLLPGESS